ncbi:MAG: ribosome maturation factor RimM [Anaerolineae bacterium]|jgi:16S rRNA processing protein RimM|nr:16S rRNA processing protein RimM [Chloroflexota bacterium]
MSPVHPSDHQYLVIGQIVAPHGLRGQVKVRVESDDPDRFFALKHVFVGPEHRRYRLLRVLVHKEMLLLSLEGVSDRNAAETLRNALVCVDLQNALPLDSDEYFQYQIEGLRVQDEAGSLLGTVTEVLETGANDVYVIRGPVGELLLPALKGVVLRVDLEAGSMTVRVPAGLTD